MHILTIEAQERKQINNPLATPLLLERHCVVKETEHWGMQREQTDISGCNSILPSMEWPRLISYMVIGFTSASRSKAAKLGWLKLSPLWSLLSLFVVFPLLQNFLALLLAAITLLLASRLGLVCQRAGFSVIRYVISYT